MNISNIDKYIKNINIVTYCLCIFILLRILLSNNINAAGAKGAIFFAVAAPLLCWDYHKNFVNAYTINEREEYNMNEADCNELTEIELQAQEIAEKYSITVDDAKELLAEGTYDEVCEALDEAEAELQVEKIVEAYSITVDDAKELLAEGTYDEVCEALDEAIEELNSEESETEYDESKNERDDSVSSSDKDVKNENLHSKVNFIRRSRELDI